MKALVCRTLGGPELLSFEKWAVRRPGVGEVTVALHASGLNFPDLLQIAGTYQTRIELPFVFGAEGAGEVIACGEGVSRFARGDRVAVRSLGCYAEQVTVAERLLVKLDDVVGMLVGAAFPVTYGTAWHALVDRGRLAAGETLLIHGASGGVGLAAVQIGKYLNARVIATGSNDARLADVRAAGADHVINHRVQPLREALRKLTEGRGVDVVLDTIGGDLFDVSVKSMAPFGRLLVVGFVGGRIAQAASNLLLLHECEVIGVNLGAWAERCPREAQEQLEKLQALIAVGRLPRVAQTFALAEGAAALDVLRGGEIVGKRVLLTERGKNAASS